MNTEGSSLLVVEQDVVAALEFADYAYTVDQGRTAAGGPAAAIAANPAVRTACLGP
jgi:branched-chain amino acid transport system ATP-binding protein